MLRNQAGRKIKMPMIGKGLHTLRIYAIDPGVAIDRILIDPGGLKLAYSSIPETRLVKTGSK